MKVLQKILFTVSMVVGLSLSVWAQKEAPKKDPPPKGTPPVVTPVPKAPPPKEPEKKKPNSEVAVWKNDSDENVG